MLKLYLLKIIKLNDALWEFQIFFSIELVIVLQTMVRLITSR